MNRAPTGVADPILNDRAAYIGDMVDALGGWLMGGTFDVAVLSAAEVDRFGNLNALLIGDPARPDVRLPGTGGNTDAACLAPRVITIMPLEPRRFVERVSFRTSPGYLDGSGGTAGGGAIAAGAEPGGDDDGGVRVRYAGWWRQRELRDATAADVRRHTG